MDSTHGASAYATAVDLDGSLSENGNHPGGSNSPSLTMVPQGTSVFSIFFVFLKMTTSHLTGSFHVSIIFVAIRPKMTSSQDPLETLFAGFEVPTSYYVYIQL
jgi:hypothetical protein